MIKEINYKNFNRKLIGTDWRYSCAGLGIMRFLDFCQNNNNSVNKKNSSYKYLVEDDENGVSSLYYNFEDVDNTNIDNFKKFIVKFYPSILWTDKFVKSFNLLKEYKEQNPDKCNKENNQYKKINDKYNKSLNVFYEKYHKDKKEYVINIVKECLFLNNFDDKKTLFDVLNKDNNFSKLKNVFLKYQEEIIKDSNLEFKINNRFFGSAKHKMLELPKKNKDTVCRLSGYYYNTVTKKTCHSYFYDEQTLENHDELEFDYIIFGVLNFTNYDWLFINNNFDFNNLKIINNHAKSIIRHISSSNLNGNCGNFLSVFTELNDIIRNNIEIIIKKVKNINDKGNIEFYEGEESVYLTINTLSVLNKIKNVLTQEKINKIPYSIFYSEKIKIDFSRTIFNCIIKNINLDDLINKILVLDNQYKKNHNYYIDILIKINNILYDEERTNGLKNMETKEQNESTIDINEKQKKYYLACKASSSNIAKILRIKCTKDNTIKKLNSFRIKLLIALVSNNYERFNIVLTQMMSYYDMNFLFASYLIDDFESNKNLAFNFINNLNNSYDNKNNE